MNLTFNSMNSFYHSENEARMTCPICGKNFNPAPEHAYHIKRGQKNFVCSWSCMRKWEKGEVKGLKPQEVKPKRYKAVRVVETGEIFNSAKECADHLNAALSLVYKAISHRTTCHGLHIEAVWEGDTE